jgi:hypothetical protein
MARHTARMKGRGVGIGTSPEEGAAKPSFKSSRSSMHFVFRGLRIS